MANRILIPLDGSPLAEVVLPHAVALAQGEGCHIYLLTVLEQSRTGVLTRGIDPLDWQLRLSEAEAYLNNISSKLREAGLQTSVEIMEGRPAESVIKYAHEINPDLILLSSHGQSGLSGWNVSSVVQKILMRVYLSVMIVRAYQPPPAGLTKLAYKRIMLPLDGSQRAENALNTAVSLARDQEAELLLAHIVRQPELPRRTPPSQEDLDLANQLTERNRAEADRYLSELTTRLDVKAETRLIVAPHVGNALHELTQREQVDLVVMNAHGYSGGVQWPFGSLVVSFIAYGVTPLLIIQDVPMDRVEPTLIERIVQEQGGR